jgi:hypothetical protein
MPTAAKLVAAIMFAAVAWVAAALYARAMPEGRSAGGLREVSALIGLICGWSIMGSFASRPCGRVEAMGTGIRTSFTMAIVGLTVFSVAQMLTRSMTGRYKDPVEAVIAVFDLMLSFGQTLLTAEIMAVLMLGGVLGGAVAHFAGRTWR